jgi:hypothetical protein
MGSLKPFHVHLENLQCKAKNLTATGLALTNLFTEEASRLDRWDEASRLRTVYRAIVGQLEQAKGSESSASYGYSQANLMFSLSGFAVRSAVAMVSKNKRVSAFADYLFKSPTSKERPFGLVLVYIGPKGLPGDAGVVSISQLARESKREESEIINKLRERDCLLFSEKTFSLLIDRLIDDIREGRLRLPVSGEKLSEVMASGELNLRLKKTE